MQRLLEEKNKSKLEFFNLGSSKGSTVLEIVNSFEKANNIKINYEIKPRRAGGIVGAYADYSLAKIELDWNTITPLQISIQTAWKFQQQLGSSAD